MWAQIQVPEILAEGNGKGETEIFIDNLPGGPDNIYLAPDGSFWIALLQVLQKIWNSAGFIFFSV